jgi:hypothetical protein
LIKVYTLFTVVLMSFYIKNKVALNNMVEQLAVLLCIWQQMSLMLETELGNQLFGIRFLTIFLNHSMHMLGQYYKTDHNHFLPQSSKFIVHKSPHHIMLQNQYSSRSIINKRRINHKLIIEWKLKIV